MKMSLENRRVTIVGLGKSGLSAARLCLLEGARVTGLDARPAAELDPELERLGIPMISGEITDDRLGDADLVVVSPGVPPHPALERAAGRGIPVIGELELGASRLRAPIVAVGGTNGKSTVTTLLGALLSAEHARVFVGGNLGTPVCDAVGLPWEVVVLEVSSFQLERAPTFHPRVSVLLNLSEDHLDRYPSFESYAAAKGNAFTNQEPADTAVVPFGDARSEAQARRGRGRLLRFGKDGDYAVRGDRVVESATGEAFDLSSSRLFGAHNHENAAAALCAARALGGTVPALQRALGEFLPLPHRMTYLTSISDVHFYDDSKATNVGAAVTALLGLREERAVLIAGGRDKLGSYGPLADALGERGRGLVLIGEAAPRIAEAVGSRVPVRVAKDMDQAVALSLSLARPGDAVLLSPACSSFDMFESYRERGECFQAAVLRLSAGASAGGTP